jgi:DNA-binding NtrC family response regulator
VSRRKILVVDDDEGVRRQLVESFPTSQFIVEEASSCGTALRSFQAVHPDVAIIDFQLPDGNALELLPKLKQLEPAVPIVVTTGYGSFELGAALIKGGAEQCFSKPFDVSTLLLVVQKLLENKRNQQKQIALNSRRRRGSLNPFLGNSEVIRDLAARAASPEATALS